jgi:hypothetical protein
MKSNHDDIGEMLPEYAAGALSSDRARAVEAHVRECRDCSEVLSLLLELHTIGVPDPGDLFWKTLPLKVRVSAKEKTRSFSIRSVLSRYLPVAAAIAIVCIAALTAVQRKERADVDPFFKDPLAQTVLDYSDITEEDIPEITEPFPVGEIYPGTDITGHGYHGELASLNSDEMNRLSVALGIEQKNGG